MAKGYWVGSMDVEDVVAYTEYAKMVLPLLARWDAAFVVRGGAYEIVEGSARSRILVIEFPSYQRALDCYHSDDYQAVKQLRLGNSVADFAIVEGFDGEQPRLSR